MSPAAAAQSQPIGSVTNGPSQDAVLAVYIGQLKVAKAAKNDVAKSYKDILTAAKETGLNTGAIQAAMKIVESGDVEKWIAQTRAISTCLRVMRYGVTSEQMELDFQDSREPIDDRAAGDGLWAGRSEAEESDNPHQINTPAGQAWLGAFRTGRAEVDLVLSMGDSGLDEDSGDSGDDSEQD